MSRRRNPRRSAAIASDNSDKDHSLLEVLLLSLCQTRNVPKTRKPRKTKKSGTANQGTSGITSGRVITGSKTPGRGSRTQNSGTVSQALTSTEMDHSCGSSLDWESDIHVIEDEIKSNHQKDIENKVNNFFKSGNLMSDDDDDELSLPKIAEKQPPKEPKEFYLLSDSDDEAPTIKDSITCTETVQSQHTPAIEITTVNTTNENDELMDIVDKILECNDEPLEVNTQPDESWTEFKSKTEEILGSVNALLGEFEDPLKDKEEKVVQKSPEKLKPSCPICLEVLGGDVVAASTMCGHIFCHACIRKVARTSKTCPTCRKRVNLKQIHPLYL